MLLRANEVCGPEYPSFSGEGPTPSLICVSAAELWTDDVIFYLRVPSALVQKAANGIDNEVIHDVHVANAVQQFESSAVMQSRSPVHAHDFHTIQNRLVRGLQKVEQRRKRDCVQGINRGCRVRHSVAVSIGAAATKDAVAV